MLKVFYTSDQVLQFKRDRLYTNEDLIGKGEGYAKIARIFAGSKNQLISFPPSQYWWNVGPVHGFLASECGRVRLLFHRTVGGVGLEESL